MNGCVLDASAAIAMVLQDERTEANEALLEHIAEAGALVTALWHLEVANVLLMAERRKRLLASDRLAALADLKKLPIDVDPSTIEHAWGETMLMAERHALTLYDASYLELAIRSRRTLATRDKELIYAADVLGLPVR